MTLLTKETREIIHNFGTINNSIVIKPGNRIRTISIHKNLLASADVSELFTRQISIYDVGSFVETLKAFDQPKLVTDNDNYILITESNDTTKRAKFYYADPGVIVQPPDKDISLPDIDMEFELTDRQLKSLLDMTRIHKVPYICVYGDGETISICSTDKKNDTSNVYSIDVGQTDRQFCYCFKAENMQLLHGLKSDYSVSISGKNVALFDGGNIRYWVALEP